MNVLLITTISGFLPKFLMQNVRILQGMGYTVHYASNFDIPVYECDRTALESQGIVCHQISIEKSPLKIGANLAALRQLKKLAEQEDIRAIHCNNPMGGVLGRVLWKRGGSPYIIYTAHGFHFYRKAPWKNWIVFYPVERMLAHRTNQLITINREDKAMSDTFRLRRRGSTVMIPGVGLDACRFRPRPERRDEYRKKLGADAKDYIFLSVGELNDNKNHKTIIRAFSEIARAKARLFICGEGTKHEKLQKLIDSLGLTDRVILWGYQTRIEEYYQCADCFLFPSIREGLGMAAIEAMACGLPVIAGDNRGAREYVFDNGILCEPTDTASYVRAMQAVMADTARAKRMGIRSREIAAGFTEDKTAEVMRKVYERMNDEIDAKKR